MAACSASISFSIASFCSRISPMPADSSSRRRESSSRPPLRESSSASTCSLFPMHLGGLGLSLGGLTAAGLRPVPQGGPFRLSLLESFPEGFSLLGQAAHLALEPDLLLPGDGKLPSRPGQGGFGGGRLLGQTGDLFFGLALFAKIPRLLLQPFDLGPAGEQARALTLEPPVMEPPALTTWPSRETTRNR